MVSRGASPASGEICGLGEQKFLTNASSEGVESPGTRSPSWFPGIANIGAG